jgi:hypothetical protein
LIDATQGCRSALHVGQGEGRKSAHFRRGVQAQLELGEDPERAFASHEQRQKVETVGATPSPHHLAGTEHAFDAGHHVFDLAIAARALAGAACRDPTAHRGTENARRIVTQREAVAHE